MGHVVQTPTAGAMLVPSNGKGHALGGPSGSPKWMNCPGAVHLEATLPQGEVSEAAEEGTAAHYVGERDLSGDPIPLGTLLRTEAGYECEVTQEMLDAVKIYTGHVMEGEVELGTDAEVEAWVELEPGLVSGTVDALIIGAEALKVDDLKYGVGVEVDPEWNPQIMIYALAAIKGLELPDDTEVELTIVQPRHYKDRKVKSWFTTVGVLQTWGDFELYPAIEALKAATAEGPFVPGEKQCQWCEAARQSRCPALIADGRNFSVNFDAGPMMVPVAEMSMEELAHTLQLKTMFKAWAKMVDSRFDAAFARAHTLLEAGYTVPGHKRVYGRKGRPQWVVAEEEVVALCADNMVNPHKEVLETPAKLRDLFKKEAPDALEALLGMMEAKQGTIVVPESNKKDALLPKATPEEIFKNN